MINFAKNTYHHGDLRDALLSNAEQQLEEEGPAGLSLRKLGRALGVSPGAPYRHFEDKDALLAALAAIGFRRLRKTMLAELEGAQGGEERLCRLGIGYIKFAWAHPELFRLMFGLMPNRGSPELCESVNAAFAVFIDGLEQCEQEGLLKHGSIDASLLGWSAVHGAAFLLIDNNLNLCGKEPDPEDIGRRLHAALWVGISK